MKKPLRNFFMAGLNLLSGTILGLALLEITLWANPGLLLRGMALPSPVDAPITEQIYDVHYSDADLFFWERDLIRPIPAQDDRLEARVHFQTDEFGFPNKAPLSPQVDVVILGRSFSLGAQAEAPWPRQLADQTGLRVLNLSQTGSDIITKKDHLRKFGLPRQPRWIIVEVLPAMDILDYRPHPYLIIQDLPFPLVQGLARRLGLYSSQPSATPIYPLQVDIPGQTVKLAFFTYYLSELTVTQSMWQDSVQWQVFQSRLLDLVSMARSQSACVALLYAPTRPVIYFPLAQRPQQLAPALQGWSPWKLDSGRSLVQDSALEADLEQMQSNAPTARYLLADFARQHGLLWIDPSRALTEAAMKGDSPFMTYDSHWSAAGHRLVADLVGKALFEGACP